MGYGKITAKLVRIQVAQLIERSQVSYLRPFSICAGNEPKSVFARNFGEYPLDKTFSVKD